ncbi:MAG: phosphatase PAP2 family protein [Lentisphaerae bacterium]|nr:phosphatase PAP2 family protein [Lentisphaerota bacterium]
MLDLIVKIDHWLFLVINNRLSWEAIDSFFEEVSSLGAWPVGIIAFALLAGCGRRLMYRHVLLLVLAFAIVSPLNNMIKRVIARDRPEMVFAERIEDGTVTVRVLERKQPRRWSFPSGHSLTAFLFMTYTALNKRAYRFWAYGLAFLIAYSRVYVGVHFPLDCLAGSLLGMAFGWLAWFAFKRLEKTREIET